MWAVKGCPVTCGWLRVVRLRVWRYRRGLIMKYLRIAGFSLVELLVVILIMGTIGSVVIACFMGGMRAYERVYDFGRGEADIYIAFEMIERDLKNAVSLPGEPFKGENSIMQFPSMDAVSDMQGGGGVRIIRYWIEPEEGLLRSIDTIDGGASYSADKDKIISGKVDMQLEYHGESDTEGAGASADVWQSVSNLLPEAVHISFQMGDDEDGPIFERVIFLPGA